MYVPHMFREEDTDWLVDFMRRNSFATVVSVAEGSPVATHLPLTIARGSSNLLLRGHFAKANPHWQALGQGEALVIFTGPHAYISPRHYERWESVPTWNYLSVHAYCTAQLVDDDAGAEALLQELIAETEPSYLQRWESLSERYRNGMKQGIVGFELTVVRLEGKAKLSQNKSRDERQKIAASLSDSDDGMARATGEEMLRRLADEPS